MIPKSEPSWTAPLLAFWKNPAVGAPAEVDDMLSECEERDPQVSRTYCCN